MRSQKNHTSVLRLPSGLTVVHSRCPGAAVDYCGCVVKVGSRDDDPDAYGMAHFVEHTLFKGTRRRSSWHIINRMERVGGELNAYTTKEETVVYTIAPAGNTARAFDLLADLLTSSRFPQTELDKEREVVADEINSYLDTPSEAVYDDFEDMLYAGTPLGHNILGEEKALAGIDSARCVQYLHDWYAMDNMVIFYCGAASADRIATDIERRFAALPRYCRGHATTVINSAAPFGHRRDIGSHQSHTVMGCATPGLFDPGRYALMLLTNILGGPGMNSMLNVQLREKRGYVYSVDASATLLSDTGVFTIYFGCDPDDTPRCMELVRRQMMRLADGCLSPTQLAAAKKQYLGQLAVASDSRESMIISAARAAMYYGRVAPPSEVAAQINAISAEQISATAQNLVNLSHLSLV